MIKFLKVFITKIFLFFPILYFASFITCAQDIVAPKDTSYWKNEVQLGANFNQASFSNNWKAGGVNSVSLSGLFRGVANYEKDKTTLRHDLQMDYGFLKNDGQTSRKTLDRLYFDNKVGHKIADKLDAFASVNLITQFASGFKYEKDPVTLAEKAIYQSKFFSPAYVIEAAGIEYRPYKYLNIRVGLGGLRHTFVVDTSLYQSVPKNYGVAIGSMVRTQAIFNLVVDYDKEIMQNVILKARYTGLLDYAKISDISYTVHRIDASVSAKVNKWVNVSLTAIMLYDKDQDSKLQYSQALSLGLLYNLDVK